MAIGKSGFQAINSMTGERPVLQTFPVFVNSNHAYFINDPVYLMNTGQVHPVTAAVSAGFAGVIQSLYTSDADGRPRPLTFNQPATGGPFLASGATGFAKVNISPNQLYVAQIDVTASVGLIGNTVHISAAGGDRPSGVSRYNLAGATLGTDAERPFKIVRIFEGERNTNTGDIAAGGGVVVKLQNSVFGPNAAGI